MTTYTPAITSLVAQNPNAGLIVADASAWGINPIIPLSIAEEESGFVASKVGDLGTSFGLFQLHRGGLLGKLTKAQALNPQTNIETALAGMAPLYQQAQKLRQQGKINSTFGETEWVANHAGWPDRLGITFTNVVEPAYNKGLRSAYATLSGGSGTPFNYPGSSLTQLIPGYGVGSAIGSGVSSTAKAVNSIGTLASNTSKFFSNTNNLINLGVAILAALLLALILWKAV